MNIILEFIQILQSEKGCGSMLKQYVQFEGEIDIIAKSFDLINFDPCSNLIAIIEYDCKNNTTNYKHFNIIWHNSNRAKICKINVFDSWFGFIDFANTNSKTNFEKKVLYSAIPNQKIHEIIKRFAKTTQERMVAILDSPITNVYWCRTIKLSEKELKQLDHENGDIDDTLELELDQIQDEFLKDMPDHVKKAVVSYEKSKIRYLPKDNEEGYVRNKYNGEWVFKRKFDEWTRNKETDDVILKTPIGELNTVEFMKKYCSS